MIKSSTKEQLHPRNRFRAGYNFRFALTQEADVVAEVQTINGRTLRTLQTRAMPNQPGSVVWDGRTGDGSAVPAGAYILNLTARDSATGAVVHRRVPFLTLN